MIFIFNQIGVDPDDDIAIFTDVRDEATPLPPDIASVDGGSISLSEDVMGKSTLDTPEQIPDTTGELDTPEQVLEENGELDTPENIVVDDDICIDASSVKCESTSTPVDKSKASPASSNLFDELTDESDTSIDFDAEKGLINEDALRKKLKKRKDVLEDLNKQESCAAAAVASSSSNVIAKMAVSFEEGFPSLMNSLLFAFHSHTIM